MVGVPGVEPGTSSLSGTRSNQLSYTPPIIKIRSTKPEIRNDEYNYFSNFDIRISNFEFPIRSANWWWRQPGLNRRPRACKARALPTELCPRLKPVADAVVTPVAAIQQQSAYPTRFEPEEV